MKGVGARTHKVTAFGITLPNERNAKEAANAELRKPLLPSAQVDHATQQSPLCVAVIGCGDCGKTTFCRQFELLGHDEMDDERRTTCMTIASQNLISGIIDVVEAFGSELPVDLAADAAVVFHAEHGGYLRTSVSTAVRSLLSDARFSAAFRSALQEYRIASCCEYYASRLLADPTWGSKHFRASNEDITAIMVRTSGLVSINLEYDRKTFELIDTGGQRCERKKWPHIYEQSRALIFFASMADYDQTLYEDYHQNRLLESLVTFEKISNDQSLAEKPLFLILAKEDLFSDKLLRKRISLNTSNLFPTAPTDFDPVRCKEWMKEEFLRRCHIPNRQIHVCTINATSATEATRTMDFIVSSLST